MSDPAQPTAESFAIHLGVYGCSRAGKTRFLYQLLNLYQQQNRLQFLSDLGRTFIEVIHQELQQHGKTLPTTIITEGIEAEVRRDARLPSWRLKVRDLKGEELADQLDHLGNLVKTDLIPQQVRECDAFVFFFDPSSAENPLEIDAHHRRELQRARQFIDYVLKQRENRHLPIVFVATHLDSWEQEEAIRLRTDQWFADLRQYLQEQYRKELLEHYPPRLLDPNSTEIRISSVRGLEVEKVIERLSDLVEDCRAFAKSDRQVGQRLLAAGFSVLSLVLILVLAVRFLDKNALQVPGPLKQIPDPVQVQDWDETILKARLAEARKTLESLPNEGRLLTVAEAKQLNLHLRWMLQRLESPGSISGGTQAILLRTVQESAAYLQLQLTPRPGNLSEQSARLTTCLEELPDAASLVPDFGKVQTAYWGICRTEMIQLLGQAIQRRNSSGSKLEDLYAEILSTIRQFVQELPARRVFGGLARSELLNELKLVETFAVDRQQSRSYPATLKMVEAKLTPAQANDVAFRSLTLLSPGIAPFDIGLKPEISTTGPLYFTTKRSAYNLNIGLGKPVIAMLMLQESAERWVKLQEFDLATDAMPEAVHLGLPLLSLQQNIKKLRLQATGYELELEISGLPLIPALLAESAR